MTDLSSDAEDLTAFFRPRNIALVGASDKSNWSKLIHSRFAKFGHEGQLFAVNRSGSPAHGLPGFESCRDIDARLDMAYIYVPAPSAIEALEDAASAGIGNAVILSSGFAEAGDEGAEMQRDLAEAAKRLGVRFLGPNSLGFANIAHRSCVTCINTREPVRGGGLAIVSQSGAVANELGKFAHTQGIGLAFTAATGNEADLNLTDIVDYLVDDEQVTAIGLYVEEIKNPSRFIDVAARAMELNKPIVLLKLGRSSISAAIAKAHTGSLIGDDGIFDAMCRRYAISRVGSIEELIVTADFLGKVGPIDPPRIGFASISGGACAMYADLAELHGLAVEPFSPETETALAQALPGYVATLNPLDVTGAVIQDPGLWARVIPLLVSDSSKGLAVASTILPNTPGEVTVLGNDVKAVVDGFRAAGAAPVLAGAILQDMQPCRAEFLEQAGVDVALPNLQVGVMALGHLQRWSERLGRSIGELAQGVAPHEDRVEGEQETLAFLKANGVPVVPSTVVGDGASARQAAAQLGGRVALKIASPDIAHKTEAGGVMLDVSEDEAAKAFDAILACVRDHAPEARIDGVLVSPMRAAGTELIVSVVRDPDWGLALTVGMGGILTEVFEDSVTRLLPVNAGEVSEMLRSLRGAKLLAGFRGEPAADIDKVVGAILDIAGAAAALGPELAALEVNPLRVRASEVEALDGLAVYRGP